MEPREWVIYTPREADDTERAILWRFWHADVEARGLVPDGDPEWSVAHPHPLFADTEPVVTYLIGKVRPSTPHPLAKEAP